MRKELEIWGGLECTVNRVGDTYFDQLESNGHKRRGDDIRRFAEIGLKTIRYPFLWEHIAPNGLATADWRWADERIPLLEKYGITPIAGLTHHGSGPRYTNLLDPAFPEKLAEYAAAFAARYPRIELYTPVNEALTTARFSCLYGHWFPHTRDFLLTVQALMNECRATILSMREIRKVNPEAKLIQTDDLGRAMASPAIQEQADFENERRWLGFDLLCGKVNPAHPLWNRLLECGVRASDLRWFEENRCPPDVVGVNTYPLSNRYLDEQTSDYPPDTHGSFQGKPYADIASVHVGKVTPVTVKSLLLETWERYHLPVAITEVHIDAGREDQVRWLMECWNAAREARAEGADVRAITAWGLLGHFDWNCLCTVCKRYYESGVFDLRAPQPRATAIATAIRSLATTGDYHHPVLEAPGWWQRPTRVQHPKPIQPAQPYERGSLAVGLQSRPKRRPLLITHGGSPLAMEFALACEARGVPYALVGEGTMNLSDRPQLEFLLDRLQPWAIIHTAGFHRADEAETEPDRCFMNNVVKSRVLASLCAARGLQLMSFSTDQVFDGSQTRPYVESQPVGPINVYGRAKAEAEKEILRLDPEALIIRKGATLAPKNEQNFLNLFLRRLEQREPILVSHDRTVSLTYAPEMVHTAMNLLMDRESGIWHLNNPGEISLAELAKEVASIAKAPRDCIVEVSSDELALPARRPRYSALSSERGVFLKSLDHALDRFMTERG